MHTVEETVYNFSDLSDKAKERARSWYREGNTDIDYSYMYEMFEEAANALGIEFRQKPVKLMNGGVRYTPAIYWSGFWSQGDGACFEGTYRYSKNAAKKVLDVVNDETLVSLANRLKDVQRNYFYRLTASITHRGNYYHERSMSIDVDYDHETYREIDASDEEELKDIMSDFAHWMYKKLEQEYEYQTSDEVIDDTMINNEYEFNSDGSIY